MKQIGIIEGFRSVWTLNDHNAKKGTLKATHLAYIICYGKNPTWVVYTMDGKFVRYASGRPMIEKFHPNKAWRRIMAHWGMVAAENYSIPERREVFTKLTGKIVNLKE